MTGQSYVLALSRHLPQSLLPPRLRRQSGSRRSGAWTTWSLINSPNQENVQGV